MAKEFNSRKEKDLDDIIHESQPKFLNAVKETYFLATLGSLCIAVSGFTQQNYPQAQPYAITGAALFLIAFVCSFATKFVTSAFVIIGSYIATVSGVVMLFLITSVLYNAINLVSTLFTVVMLGVIATLMASVPYNMYQYRKKHKGKTKKVLSTSVVSFSIMIFSMIIFLIPPLILKSSALESSDILTVTVLISGLIFAISGIIAIGSTITATPLLFIAKRRQKKESKPCATYVDEGSGI